MSIGSCTPEQQAACPRRQHFSNEHHVQYPGANYRGKLEKEWRELPINKAQLCVAVHNAIHASGYIPDKPSRQIMAQEIWLGTVTNRSHDELGYQLDLGAQLGDSDG